MIVMKESWGRLMSFKIEDLKELLIHGKFEVQSGVFLICENKVLSPKVYMSSDGEAIVIEFEAPFMYLHITKLGPKQLLNIIRPRVEYIKIKENSTLVKLSTLGEWEIGTD